MIANNSNDTEKYKAVSDVRIVGQNSQVDGKQHLPDPEH